MPKISNAKTIMRDYQNWYEIIWQLANHKQARRAILRNGLCFDSRFVWWPDVYGIFSQAMYTPAPLSIEANDVVVDIGANIGVFSIYAATRTRNTVYAFEPFPDTYAVLLENIRKNNIRTIVTHQMAVSEVTGMEVFSNAQNGAMNGLNKLTVRTHDTINVPSISLPDFMERQGLDHIDFLKMDCEGAEGLILPSLSQAYFARINKIAMEFHDGMSPLDHKHLETLLQDAGFTTRITWDKYVSNLGLLFAWR